MLSFVEMRTRISLFGRGGSVMREGMEKGWKEAEFGN